jgi:hypothetical protein
MDDISVFAATTDPPSTDETLREEGVAALLRDCFQRWVAKLSHKHRKITQLPIFLEVSVCMDKRPRLYEIGNMRLQYWIAFQSFCSVSWYLQRERFPQLLEVLRQTRWSRSCH